MRATLLLCLFQLAAISLISAATITAHADGDWHANATWAGGVIPTSNDDVVIDGYAITITASSVSIKTLTITNSTAINTSSLIITNSLTVNISGDVNVNAANVSQDVLFQLSGNVEVNVGGNVVFDRLATNSTNNQMNLSMTDNAVLNVTGNFTFYYKNSYANELLDEIDLYKFAKIDVSGNSTFVLSGGKNLSVQLYDDAQFITRQALVLNKTGGEYLKVIANGSSIFKVKGTTTATASGGVIGDIILTAKDGTLQFEDDLIMNSTAAYRDVILKAEGATATINAFGDISLDAVQNNDASIILLSNSTLDLKGNIVRDSNFGNLDMDSNATFILSGGGVQEIPDADLTGSGTDSFVFTNLSINNTSGTPFVLEGPIIVDNELILQNGIIQTSAVNSLIVEDFATISGGSETAYIDGPIIKKGRTASNSFIFPVGNNGIYAPIEMDSVSNASDQFTAQYFNSTPTDKTSVTSPLTHISSKEHWTFSKTSGSKDVNISLHWKDAARSGINDIGSLVVSMYDVNNAGMGWKAIGQGNYGGSVVGSSEGWITNDLLCPPPIEDGIYTFGSTAAAANPLPAELLEFSAYKIEKKVMVQWLTTYEYNNDYFDVERSTDGINFEMIKQVKATGNNRTNNVYHIYDEMPANGSNYYRLKQMDVDGQYIYSRIINVRFYHSPIAQVQPNPVQDHFRLVGMDTHKGNVEIRIFSMEGRLVYLGNFEVEDRELHLSTSNMPALEKGAYILQYSSAAGPKSIKFIKG